MMTDGLVQIEVTLSADGVRPSGVSPSMSVGSARRAKVSPGIGRFHAFPVLLSRVGRSERPDRCKTSWVLLLSVANLRQSGAVSVTLDGRIGRT